MLGLVNTLKQKKGRAMSPALRSIHSRPSIDRYGVMTVVFDAVAPVDVVTVTFGV